MTEPEKSTSPWSGKHGGGQARPVPEEETFKDTLESIVVAFVLAFIFRAYVVEAFVIPTGSMAPTLMGQHMRVTCEQCGYVFKAEPEKPRASMNVPKPFVCPMCHYPNRMGRDVDLSAGDRILVHKYIYTIHEPQRWDVLVFKAPHQPETNYIKRLVGLPDESLCILEGNIYVQSHREGENQEWRIARKPDRPKVQRAVWQPVYHSQYVPLDRGRGTSWRYDRPWRVPWYAVTVDDPVTLVPPSPKEVSGGRFLEERLGGVAASSGAGSAGGAGKVEGDWDLQARGGYLKRTGEAGRLRFDFPTAIEGGPGLYVYNQHQGRSDTRSNQEPIEDVRVAATFEPEQGGLSVALRTTNRCDTVDGHTVTLTGRIEADGSAWLEVRDPDLPSARRLMEPRSVGAFEAGVARCVELWYVDQEASLWVDGRRVLEYQFDLPMDSVRSRRLPPTYPVIAIDVAGSPVTLHRVEVDRDLYYTSAADNVPLRGGVQKRGSAAVGEPVVLGADQYLCFGDNSPLSYDSRYWDKVDPWVRDKMFNGEEVPGIVPGELILGQAFFVYFPAPFKWFVPNFGELRFIH